MSDYISGLRSDLVAAAARERHRTHRGALAPALRPPAWRWRGALAAVALAAAAAAFVLAVVALAPKTPQHGARPRITVTIASRTIPDGAAFGAGSLWIADFNGTLVRVDPTRRRVLQRIALGGQVDSVAATGDAVWARVVSRSEHDAGTVVRIDPARGRVAARVTVGPGSGLAVGARSVWAPRKFTTLTGIDRIDRVRAARSGRVDVRDVDAVAEAGGVLWAAVHDGTIVELDAATARVLRRWPALAPSDAPALAADAGGAWVLSTQRSQILRLAGGRVARAIPVDPTTQPLLARTNGGLWITAGGGPGVINAPHQRLQRIDPRTGRITATIDLGAQRPVALVPSGHDLLVVTAAGRVLVVRS